MNLSNHLHQASTIMVFQAFDPLSGYPFYNIPSRVEYSPPCLLDSLKFIVFSSIMSFRRSLNLHSISIKKWWWSILKLQEIAYFVGHIWCIISAESTPTEIFLKYNLNERFSRSHISKMIWNCEKFSMKILNNLCYYSFPHFVMYCYFWIGTPILVI